MQQHAIVGRSTLALTHARPYIWMLQRGDEMIWVGPVNATRSVVGMPEDSKTCISDVPSANCFLVAHGGRSGSGKASPRRSQLEQVVRTLNSVMHLSVHASPRLIWPLLAGNFFLQLSKNRSKVFFPHVTSMLATDKTGDQLGDRRTWLGAATDL